MVQPGKWTLKYWTVLAGLFGKNMTLLTHSSNWKPLASSMAFTLSGLKTNREESCRWKN
jgi:hypothetical protein